MTRSLILIFTLLLVQSLMAQEELNEIPVRWEQFKNSSKLKSQVAERSGRQDEEDIRYLYNTLELGEITDEFTTYKIKIFPVSLDDPAVFDSTSYFFIIDPNQHPDSFKFKKEPSWNIVVNPFNGLRDSNKADSILVRFFSDTNDRFLETGTMYVHRTYSLLTQNGQTRRIEHEPDSTIYNSSITEYFARDDDRSLWINRGGFWNRTMGIDPPTLGVLTLDGLDSTGRPYDNSSKLTYGIADRFESKPINLYGERIGGQVIPYGASDSIYLSFFYQAQGYGDLPEKEDSLLLDFYSPVTEKWTTIWSVEGDSATDFQQVFFHIKDSIYLQEGFKFRFKNYATLSGNFDHWHLDYIRLDKNRQFNDEIVDFAIKEPIRTTIQRYTSMPWEHYKKNPWEHTADTIKLKMRNLSTKPDVAEARYRVYKGSDFNSTFLSQLQQYPSVPIGGDYEIDMTLRSDPNSFTFPLDDNERQWFRVVSQTFSSNDEYRQNDTLVKIQIFDRYYSYDDYSAEKTYHLNLVGTDVVVEFETPVEDTLKGILINFVETFEPVNFHKVVLKVYSSLEKEPIYESAPVDVIKKPAGQFHRYTLPNDVVVNGKFYVGWEQYDQNKTYVGYDVNYNNQSRTFVSEVPGSWVPSIYEGTIMLRADFGDGTEQPLGGEEITQTELESSEKVRVYPNPARNELFINTNSDIAHLKIYNLSGQLSFQVDQPTNRVNLTELEEGFYLLQFSFANGKQETKKLLIRR